MATSTRQPPRPRPIPVQRDVPTDSHTRNKENMPASSSSPTRSITKPNGRSFIPSLVQPLNKSDFFTDSYLADDHASETSLIPSPLPQSATLSRPRRRLHAVASTRDRDLRPKNPSTRPEASLPSHQYSPPSSRRHSARPSSPIHSTGLSTPPRSRNGSLTESPISARFSSPPRALTETYERIDQEEDLAATEGEISDPESEPPQEARAQSSNGHTKPALAREKSPGLTPTNARFPNFDPRSRHEDLTTASVLSDPTGMSFVNQLSDPNLAHAMTPHVMQSAADKEALRKIWDTKRPVAFGKANKFHLDADELAQSLESPPQPQPQRLIAFSKAAKRKLASDLARFPLHQRTFSDVTDRLERAPHDAGHAAQNENWDNDHLMREAMPHNPRIHRAPYFTRTHGFPEGRSDAEVDDTPQRVRQARSEPPYAQPFEHIEHRDGDQAQPTRSTTSNLVNALNLNQSEPDLTLDTRPLTQDSSAVDWMQAASGKPASTTAKGIPRRSRSRLSDAYDPETSPEKSRKFDVDFTGQSFQVSESPPVRNRSLAQDLSREQEIRGLAQRAVTTNRLTQLRAQELSERLRQSSRSSILEANDSQKENDQHNLEQQPDDDYTTETPASVHRSNSISKGKEISSTPSVRPSPDRSQSHDLLQRLARSSSSTPRSSTPSDKPGSVVSGSGAKQASESKPESISDSQDENNDTTQDQSKPASDAVKATPKVTGAWTDTILPDTIKTLRQTGQRLTYSQTPHVSAGGWIDTPAPPAQSSKLEPVPESTQEVPEELMKGIVKDSASGSGSDVTILAIGSTKPLLELPPQAGPSIAKKVLAEAKGKLRNQQSPRRPVSNVDDSLVLGNATIQSLENVLDMDETDITVLSRIGEDTFNQSDTQVLDRLTSKLESLLTNIHHAKTGISNLESQIAQPDEASAPAAPPTDHQPCEICGQPQNSNDPHIHSLSSRTYFPFTLLNVTLPIPILFRTRPAISPRKWRTPRPTPLGWLVLALWIWYLLECTLAELYSHPSYASHYIWPREREPDFPFVLPTMLWRWSRLRWVYPYLLQPVLNMVTGLLRMVGISLGIIDGFADGPSTAGLENALYQHQHQHQHQHADGVAGVLDINYMMNDELL